MRMMGEGKTLWEKVEPEKLCGNVVRKKRKLTIID